MIEAIQLESQPLNRGRPTKFTPERIQQIRNLVERGMCRDEIAEIIGVTTGTLQVTCSKLGISLRRPIFGGIGLLPRQPSRDHKSASPTQSGLQPESTEPVSAADPPPVLEANATATGKAQAGAPPAAAACRSKSDDLGSAVFKGQERSTHLPLDEEMIGQLALEAEIRGMGIGELVGAVILAIVRKDLFQLVRDDPDPQTAKTSPI
jgi:Helix-turn-helix domain of resolvase